MSNLSDLLPTGAGAKSSTFVADGTISSGVTVALQSDGTISQVSSGAGNVADFIGISDQAIADTATGSVIVQGGVSEKVTGLTVNSYYYVQDDGTLSTTASATPAGRALSTTSILLDG